MIGMGFPAFLTLLVLGLISSFVWHMLARYRVLAGIEGFMCMWIAGWIGGWLGSPIFGHWSIQAGSVYFVPAILGAFAGPFLVTATFRAAAVAVRAAPHQDAAGSRAGAAPQFEMKKAS